MAGIINNNQNLQNDLAVFDYAVETGDWGAFGGYVGAAYDSSADYWLFKLDGTIIDDQTNYFSREIIDVNGNHISEKIEGSDFEGSRIKALVEAIGIENVEKMLGESITSLNQIPDSVLESVLGVNIDISKIPEADKRMILEQNKEKIIGEYLMYKNNVIWDSTNSKWSGDELKIPGLGENDSLGVYRDDVTDQYTFFTAGITFTREDDAFEVYKNGVENKKYETLANTSAELWYKDLFNSDNNLSVSLDGNWTTVSHLKEDTTYKQYGYSSFKGNTIISEYFKMHLTTAFKNNQIQYNVDTVGVITNATTLYGQKIDKYGKIANQNQDWARWLIHPMPQSGGSAGCFGPMSDFNVGNYTSGNVGTGKFYYDKFLSQLYSMNIYNGYELNMHLKGRRIP